MSELKKCCRYCSNFHNNKCKLDLFEVEYIRDYYTNEWLDEEDYDEIDDQIQDNIIIKDPDDFYCKYYY